jgi:hypothetical protein
MITVCAWCQKYMGSREPLHDPSVSHGICSGCVERDPFDDAPVLVVSRDRAEAIPVLLSLLRGAPEIAIVVDRRSTARRGRPLAKVADRRAAERRRAPSFYLV